MMNQKSGALVLPVLLMLGAGIGLSQEKPTFHLEGVVHDSTGAPVSGAEVTLNNAGFHVTQVTDSDGRFHFDDLAIASGTLTVRSDVFFARSANLGRARAGIKPDRDHTRSQGSQTNALLSPPRARNSVSATTASSVTVLSQQDLATSGGITLDDALGQVPGFMLYRRNGSLTANPTSLGVSLRGVGTSGASRALVISDGIPLTDPFGGWVYWDRIPSTSVSRVEVVEGGVSDLYGGDALGGVINVIPRRPLDSSLTLETFYGNEQTPDAVRHRQPSSRPLAGLISIEGFHTDGYVAVLPPLEGTIDTPVASEHLDAQFMLERLFADQGRRIRQRNHFRRCPKERYAAAKQRHPRSPDSRWEPTGNQPRPAH